MNPSLSNFRPEESGQAAEAQAKGNVCPWCCSVAQGCRGPGQKQVLGLTGAFMQTADSPPSSQVFGIGGSPPPEGRPAWHQNTVAGREGSEMGIVDLRHSSTSLDG